MTGPRSSNPRGLRLAPCWDAGREGLFSQSLLSKAVYSALFSSSPAFWKSCVHWLVLLYFLSQLRDGLPGLKRPRRCLPSVSGLGEELLLPRGSAQALPFIPAFGSAPRELRDEGAPALPPILFRTEMPLCHPWWQLCCALLPLPSPRSCPGPGLPRSGCDSDRGDV